MERNNKYNTLGALQQTKFGRSMLKLTTIVKNELKANKQSVMAVNFKVKE